MLKQNKPCIAGFVFQYPCIFSKSRYPSEHEKNADNFDRTFYA